MKSGLKSIFGLQLLAAAVALAACSGLPQSSTSTGGTGTGTGFTIGGTVTGLTGTADQSNAELRDHWRHRHRNG